MRIIAGLHRSRTLAAPAGVATRPTSDRLRETLFNVLAPRIEGASFLDLYAGSGAVGIEALSRGAARVEFVEHSPHALLVLKKNLDSLGVGSDWTDSLRIHNRSAAAFLRLLRPGSKPESKQGQRTGANQAASFDIVFLDPPYDADREYSATLGLLGGDSVAVLAPGAIVIAEHRRKQPLQIQYGQLSRTRLLEQGDAALSFYAVVAPAVLSLE